MGTVGGKEINQMNIPKGGYSRYQLDIKPITDWYRDGDSKCVGAMKYLLNEENIKFNEHQYKNIYHS